MNEICLLLVGTNHKFSPVGLREEIFSKTDSPDDWVKKTYSELDQKLFSEVVILSTCNRTELYAITINEEKARSELSKKLSVKNFYTYTNQDALFHLFSVAAGMDSMILGEHEILGQVKKAYQQGISGGKPGLFLHQLFRQAIHTGKEVRTKTNIGKGSLSLTNAVISLAQKHIKRISTCQVLVIGAGAIAQKLTRNLWKKTHISITNRTYKHAERIANTYPVNILPYDALEKNLIISDLIISAAATIHPIITISLAKKVMKKRNKQICFIDIGMPRNIQTNVATIKNIIVYNLDDIQQLIDDNYAKRNISVRPAIEIIKREIDMYWTWFLNRTFRHKYERAIVSQIIS